MKEQTITAERSDDAAFEDTTADRGPDESSGAAARRRERAKRAIRAMMEADRARAARARATETATARIARRRGWLPIAATPTPETYVSGQAALNLRCPWNFFADWHGAMWQAPPEEIEEKLLWVEAKRWETSAVLGREGIYDARKALRLCRARFQIGALGIGGHPQGYALKPVYAAGHARAVIDLVHEEFRKGEKAWPNAAPKPLESALWLSAAGQRDWARSMAQRLEDAADAHEARLWKHWGQEILDIEREGASAVRRWTRS